MVYVGGKNFSDTKAGKEQAREHAKRTGQTYTQKNRKPVRKQRNTK